jgi:hypothetical protein
VQEVMIKEVRAQTENSVMRIFASRFNRMTTAGTGSASNLFHNASTNELGPVAGHHHHAILSCLINLRISWAGSPVAICLM